MQQYSFRTLIFLLWHYIAGYLLTKRSLYYAADTAMLSLGLEVDLFRQKLPKDTRTVARRYANRLPAVTSRRCRRRYHNAVTTVVCL